MSDMPTMSEVRGDFGLLANWISANRENPDALDEWLAAAGWTKASEVEVGIPFVTVAAILDASGGEVRLSARQQVEAGRAVIESWTDPATGELVLRAVTPRTRS